MVLVRGRSRFRVTRDPDDPWANDDPAKLRAGLKKVAALLTPEEGDRIIEAMDRRREEGTRPFDHHE